jgi:hypothetical protein
MDLRPPVDADVQSIARGRSLLPEIVPGDDKAHPVGSPDKLGRISGVPMDYVLRSSGRARSDVSAVGVINGGTTLGGQLNNPDFRP